MRRVALAGLLALACEQADPPPPSPETCGTAEEIEAKIVLPKCGRAGDGACHATGSAPPRLAAVGMMAQHLVERPGVLHCHGDVYVSRAAPERSYLLAKIRTMGASATCSDGSNGGPAMPYQDAPRLSTREVACLEAWVAQMARRE